MKLIPILNTVMNCIANARPEMGLAVKTELDTGAYPTGIHVDNETLVRLELAPKSFRGKWNYMIETQSPNNEVISS